MCVSLNSRLDCNKEEEEGRAGQDCLNCVWGCGFGVWESGLGGWSLGFGVWGLKVHTGGAMGEKARFENNYITEMCSGPEADSYLWLLDFVYLSSRGVGVINKERTRQACSDCVRGCGFGVWCLGIGIWA